MNTKNLNTIFIFLIMIIFSGTAHAFSFAELKDKATELKSQLEEIPVKENIQNIKANIGEIPIKENLEKIKPLAQKSGSFVATIYGKQQQKKYTHNLEATVLRVLDGDTVEVRFNNPPQGIKNIERIRLSEIDAPESNQNWGSESTQALHSQINNQKVAIAFDTKDDYGRIIGTIFKDNININYWMVKEGQAWQYKRFSDSKILAGLEKNARSKQIGLWSQPKPIEPWNFR